MFLLTTALAAPLEPAPDRAGLPKGLPAWGVLVQDVDGDGAVEFSAVSHGTLPLWYSLDAEARFQDVADPWGGERADRHGITACDLDADGDRELVVARGGARGTGGTALEVWDYRDGVWVDVSEPFRATEGVRMRGLSCVDVDGDGRAELYVPGAKGKKSDQLWAFDEGWIERAEAWGLTRLEVSNGGLFADLDGDLDQDLVRIEGGDVGILLQADGAFVRTASPRQVGVRDAALFDLENDGDLDLYLARSGVVADTVGDQGARLFFDEGDTDTVTWQFPQECSVVRLRVQGELDGQGARVVTAEDSDRHQVRLRFDPSFRAEPEGAVVAWVSPVRRRVHLRATADEGRLFVGLECIDGGVQGSLLSAEVDEGGRIPPRQDVILVNDGLGGFTAIEAPGSETADVAVLDVDLDGDDDLFLVGETEPGVWANGEDTLLVNEGGTLQRVSIDDPRAFGRGTLAVPADLDGDRFPEVIVVNGEYDGTLAGHSQVWNNPGVEGHHWIEVEVYEPDGQVRSLGARVQVIAAGSVQRRSSARAPDHRSNGTTSAVFGLGEARLAQVLVTWPDGSSVVHDRVPAGTTLRVVKP